MNGRRFSTLRNVEFAYEHSRHSSDHPMGNERGNSCSREPSHQPANYANDFTSRKRDSNPDAFWAVGLREYIAAHAHCKRI